MQKPDRIDFEKLLGFELVTIELLKALDFQDETIADKLGAKVGAEVGDEPERKS
jgi:hypothetical protein